MKTKKIMTAALAAVAALMFASAPAPALAGPPPGAKYANPACKERPVKGSFRCKFYSDPKPCEFYNRNSGKPFSWFREKNNLKVNIGPTDTCEPNTAYVIGVF